MAQSDKGSQQIPVVGGAVLVCCPDNNDGAPPKTYLINYLTGSTMPAQKPEEEAWKKTIERTKAERKRKDSRNSKPESNTATAQTPASQPDNISTTSTTISAVEQPSTSNTSTAKVKPPTRLLTRRRRRKVLSNIIEKPENSPINDGLLVSRDQNQQLVDKPVQVRATRMQTRKNKSDTTDTKSNTERVGKTITNTPVSTSKSRKSKSDQKSNCDKDDLNALNNELDSTDAKLITEHLSKTVSNEPTNVSRIETCEPASKGNPDSDELSTTTNSEWNDQTDLHDTDIDGSPAKRQKRMYRDIKPYLKIEDVVKAMTKVSVKSGPDAQETGFSHINSLEQEQAEDHFGVEATRNVTTKETIKKEHGDAIVSQTNTKRRSVKVIRLPLLTKANLELGDIHIEVEIEKGLYVGSLERETLENGNSKFNVKISNESFKDAIKPCNDTTEDLEEGNFRVKSGTTHPSPSKDQRKGKGKRKKTKQKTVKTKGIVECDGEPERMTYIIAGQHTSDKSEEAPGESTISDINIASAGDATSVGVDDTPTTSAAMDYTTIEGDMITSMEDEKAVEGLQISLDNLASVLNTDTRVVFEEDLFDGDVTQKPTKKRHYVKLDKPVNVMEYHVKLGKDGKRLYVCNICGHESKGNMSSHFRMHRGERPYQCCTCGKAFTNKSNYNKHLLTHSSNRPFSCDVCEFKFKSRTALRIHAERHYNPGKHMCQFCGKCFHTPRELEAHAQMHNNEPKFECSVCKKKFQHSHAQRRHEQTHATGGGPGHQCHLCGATFSRGDNYRSHLKKKHGDKIASDRVCQSKTPAWKRDVKHSIQPEQEVHNIVVRIEPVDGPEAEYMPVEEVAEMKEEATDGREEVQIVYVDGASEIPHAVQEVEVELATHELATLLAGFHKTA